MSGYDWAIVDERGERRAVVRLEPPSVAPLDLHETELADWGREGVPSRRGRDAESGLRLEEPFTVPPGDELWGLALLEELERRGWRAVALGVPIEASEPVKAGHGAFAPGHPFYGNASRHLWRAEESSRREGLPAKHFTWDKNIAEKYAKGGKVGHYKMDEDAVVVDPEDKRGAELYAMWGKSDESSVRKKAADLGVHAMHYGLGPTYGMAVFDLSKVKKASEPVKAVHVREYTRMTERGPVTVHEHEDVRVKQPEPFVPRLLPGPMPVTVLQVDDMKQVGGSLGGSTPGAQYQDKDGAVWYVKQVKSQDHARNEALAARLYRLAGVRVPEIQLAKSGDNVYIASRLEKLLGHANLETPGAAQGFAADAWLANWDAVGKDYDNLQVADDGSAIRIDVGGSLGYRAQGKLKGDLFGDVPGEINSLRDPNGPNPQSSNVFGQLGPADVKDAVMATVAKVTDSQIDAAVLMFSTDKSPVGGVPAKALAARLKARRDWLVKAAQSAKAAKKAEAAEGAPSIKGVVYGQDKTLFSQSEWAAIFQPAQEPKPKLPSGPQMRAMREASAKALKKFTTENWSDPAHPRPDRDGVPTNAQALEFQRLHSIGQNMCGSWKGSAQGEGASRLKRAALRVFNANGIVFGSHGADVDNEETRWDNDRVVRMMYRDTQERMAAKGVTEHDRILLYRGVKNHIVTSGVLEGHSLSKEKAKAFDSHDVIKRWVHPTEVLVDNKSSFLHGGGYEGETEWFVFAGGFGAAASEAASAKYESEAKQTEQSGIKDFGGAKAKVPKYTWKQNVKPHEAVTVAGEKAEKQWAKVDDAAIIAVKKMYAQGSKASVIAKQLGLAPGTVSGILIGKTKKYAQTGPRTPGMKSLLSVSDLQWAHVKYVAGEALKKYGKIDFGEVESATGIKAWKAQAIYFAKKKGAP